MAANRLNGRTPLLLDKRLTYLVPASVSASFASKLTRVRRNPVLKLGDGAPAPEAMPKLTAIVITEHGLTETLLVDASPLSNDTSSDVMNNPTAEAETWHPSALERLRDWRHRVVMSCTHASAKWLRTAGVDSVVVVQGAGAYQPNLTEYEMVRGKVPYEDGALAYVFDYAALSSTEIETASFPPLVLDTYTESKRRRGKGPTLNHRDVAVDDPD